MRSVSTVGLSLLLLLGACATEPSTQLAEGPWSGSGASLEVDGDSAEFRAYCVHATLPAPLPLDSAGEFSVAVLIVTEFGLIREDSGRVHGSLRSGQLRLTLFRAGISDSLGPYLLVRRAGPLAFPCRLL